MSYCKECGNKLEDGANFCPKCGCPTESTLVNDSDTIVDNGKFAPNVQVQPTNQFEASTGEKSKLGCWSKIFYAIGVFIFLGYLAEKCGGDDTNVDEGNASQATEQVVSDEGQEETDKVAKAGYDDGYNCAFTNSEDMEYHEGENEESVRTHYTYFTGFKPKNDKYYKIYRENFWKGYKDGVKAR